MIACCHRGKKWGNKRIGVKSSRWQAANKREDTLSHRRNRSHFPFSVSKFLLKEKRKWYCVARTVIKENGDTIFPFNQQGKHYRNITYNTTKENVLFFYFFSIAKAIIKENGITKSLESPTKKTAEQYQSLQRTITNE